MTLSEEFGNLHMKTYTSIDVTTIVDLEVQIVVPMDPFAILLVHQIWPDINTLWGLENNNIIPPPSCRFEIEFKTTMIIIMLTDELLNSVGIFYPTICVDIFIEILIMKISIAQTPIATID